MEGKIGIYHPDVRSVSLNNAALDFGTFQRCKEDSVKCCAVPFPPNGRRHHSDTCASLDTTPPAEQNTSRMIDDKVGRILSLQSLGSQEGWGGCRGSSRFGCPPNLRACARAPGPVAPWRRRGGRPRFQESATATTPPPTPPPPTPTRPTPSPSHHDPHPPLCLAVRRSHEGGS